RTERASFARAVRSTSGSLVGGHAVRRAAKKSANVLRSSTTHRLLTAPLKEEERAHEDVSGREAHDHVGGDLARAREAREEEDVRRGPEPGPAARDRPEALRERDLLLGGELERRATAASERALEDEEQRVAEEEHPVPERPARGGERGELGARLLEVVALAVARAGEAEVAVLEVVEERPLRDDAREPEHAEDEPLRPVSDPAPPEDREA